MDANTMDRFLPSKKLRKGVYFVRADCAGLLRRCAILAIDMTVLVVLGVVLAVLDAVLFERRMGAVVGCVWLGLAYVYLAPLKRSVGTVGFFLTQTKIVDIYGKPPSLSRMTFRLFLCLFWFLSNILLIDFFWSGGNHHRQTLRDLLAGTYVVRKAAVPAGEASVCLVYYFLFSVVFQRPEVQLPWQIRRSKTPVSGSGRVVSGAS